MMGNISEKSHYQCPGYTTAFKEALAVKDKPDKLKSMLTDLKKMGSFFKACLLMQLDGQQIQDLIPP